eukprot:362754-Chlamydomonas_euryale.AAC.12
MACHRGAPPPLPAPLASPGQPAPRTAGLSPAGRGGVCGIMKACTCGRCRTSRVAAVHSLTPSRPTSAVFACLHAIVAAAKIRCTLCAWRLGHADAQALHADAPARKVDRRRALPLCGRGTAHVGTRTAVQIRSHAQKWFGKLHRGQVDAGATFGEGGGGGGRGQAWDPSVEGQVAGWAGQVGGGRLGLKVWKVKSLGVMMAWAGGGSGGEGGGLGMLCWAGLQSMLWLEAAISKAPASVLDSVLSLLEEPRRGHMLDAVLRPGVGAGGCSAEAGCGCRWDAVLGAGVGAGGMQCWGRVWVPAGCSAEGGCAGGSNQQASNPTAVRVGKRPHKQPPRAVG